MRLTRKDVAAAVRGNELDALIIKCEADRRDISSRPFSMLDGREFWYNSAVFWHAFVLKSLSRRELVKAWSYAARRDAAIRSFNESPIA